MPKVLIDFNEAGRRRVYDDPAEILIAHNCNDVLHVLARVDEATRMRGLHAVGYISYEAAPAFDRAFAVRTGSVLPLAWFGLYRVYTEVETPGPQDATATAAARWYSEINRAEYETALSEIREAIAEGRTYQVNLTTRLRASFAGNAEAWYEALRRAQGPGFHAFLELDDFSILSISPELFFARRGNLLVTRPMKGTRPRGRWPGEDRERAEELTGSAKDRAENLMIVDLLRSDLGRIADMGSVHVPQLFQLERYRTVWQLTSTIQARVAEDTTLRDILGALFPCGSVTGAPKISTMRLIAGLEQSPREVYCGAIGIVEPGGDCTFNVPIRTAWINKSTGIAEYGVGSGITWDSVADAEFQELQTKARVLTESWPSFELLETMRIAHGSYARLDRHLARMRASAGYFGFPFPADTLRAALHEQAATLPTGEWRVRLLLADGGNVQCEAHVLGEPAVTRPVALACHPFDSSNRFLYHKTTHRQAYERALATHPEAFDVLLWNERGELTEFTRGNLVLEIAGMRCTPAQSSGLLAGAFRAELLERGTIEERVLYMEDLGRANRIWFINSVREWVECSLMITPGRVPVAAT